MVQKCDINEELIVKTTSLAKKISIQFINYQQDDKNSII
jgi:hypothetical protein